MNTYLALDLGGTKLMIAEVTEEGKILRSKQYKSGYPTQEEGVAAFLQALTTIIRRSGFRKRPSRSAWDLPEKSIIKKVSGVRSAISIRSLSRSRTS